jgi:iron(III) transport system permease protein
MVAPPSGQGRPSNHRSSNNLPIWIWLGLGLVGFICFPWFALPEGKGFWQSSSALGEILGRSVAANSGADPADVIAPRPWLSLGAAGLLLAALVLSLPRTFSKATISIRHQGQLLFLAAVLPLLTLIFLGFALPQPSLGSGGVLTLVSLLMLSAFGLARQGAFRGDLFVAAAVLACAAILVLFILFPVSKTLLSAFFNEQGGLDPGAFVQRITTDRVWGLSCLSASTRCGVAWNTLFLALLTAAGTTLMGSLLALLAERGNSSTLFGRSLKLLALLPIITPPFVVGLGLILLFGRAGVFNQFLEWAFGIPPGRWFYGLFGVWFAQMFAFTPIAYLIMRGVVQGLSPSLEEAAQTLGASRSKTFFTITLPMMKPGLANAFLVGFIESIADFGNPIVVGGQFTVLSTEIFFAIVGAQFDQGRAASLAWILTLFALGVFALQQAFLGKQSYTTLSGKGDSGVPAPLPTSVRRLAKVLIYPWLAFTLVIYGFALMGGIVKTWGRDYTLTLQHFKAAFDVQWGEFGMVWAGTAWSSLFTTVKLAAIASPITAILGLLVAFLIARVPFRGQKLFEFAALLAFAIPGTVLGVSYILAFNVPPFELTGTGLIIILCFVFRNLPVGVRAGTAAFKQLDKSLDEASLMLRASTATTLRRVLLPLLKPALVAALIYSFVRAMTTVSAVIFLVTAEYELATTYIIGRVGNGDYGIALAYCTVLMILMSLATMAIQRLVGERKLGRREKV